MSVDASCRAGYSDGDLLYTPLYEEPAAVDCQQSPPWVPASPPPAPPPETALPAAEQQPNPPQLASNMAPAGFLSLAESAAAALAEEGFAAASSALGFIARGVPLFAAALVLLDASPTGDGSAPESPGTPGSGQPDDPNSPDIGPVIGGYLLSRALNERGAESPRDFENAGAPGRTEVGLRDVNGQLVPQSGFLPPFGHPPTGFLVLSPVQNEDPDRAVASAGSGNDNGTGVPDESPADDTSDPANASEKTTPPDRSNAAEGVAERVRSGPGRYDTTLTAIGSQRHHVLAGVESAALSLQDAHNVAILVGSNNVLGQPNSDGFTGAAELGLALQNTGKNVFYVTHDQQGAQAMRKLLADMGHPVSRGHNEVMVFDSTYGTEAKLQSNTLLDEFGIDHVVAVDVPGRNAEGLYSDPRGFPIADVNSPLDEVVRIANQRADVTTIGIGSDGNEVGMAGVHASGDRTATIPTEHSITAWNSSLGAQALGIEVNRLNGTPVKNQPTEWQRETALETLLSSGAYDEGLPGELRDATPGVKGYGPQVHAAMAKLLESQAGKPPGQIGYRFEAGSYRVVAAFDSSNGGILAAGNLAAALQHANVGPVRFVVVVDHGNAPYGRKDPVTQLPSLVNNALTATESIGPATGSGVGDVQVIAMACNTACTPTKSIYAKGVDVPVIDLIDTTVSEIISSGGAHPVSISTVTTAQSHAYGDGVALAAAGGDKSALSTQRSRVSGDDIFRWDTTINDEHGNPRSPSQITEIGALSWADIVNSIEHTSNDPGAQAYVAKEIRAIVDQVPDDATSVWLTCTHFPALKPLIQQALLERGLDIDVVDPMEFQASTMADVLHSTAPQDGLTPTPLAHGINRPPKVILTTGSENKDVPGSARALSGRKDALVFHVPTFDPSSPELQDVQAYIHGALSADGSPYDPLLVSFNSRSIAKLHDNGRVEAAAIATKNANNVVILTNFNVGEGMPETDGPPGAAALGRAYATVGKEVTYVVSDEPAKTVLRAALREFGVLNASIEVFSAGSDAEGRVRAEHLLKRLQADAVVAVEVPGRTEETGPVNMRGVPIGSFNSPLYEITLAANRTKGIVTIGVFDGGNEIGAGNVSDRVPLALDGKTVMASDIPVDYHVAAWNSNFGADTLAIEVLRQHGMLDHAHTAQELVSSIEATMQAGAVDGVTRGSVPGERIGGGESGVDGFSPWVHGVMHDIQMRNALNRPEPRAEFPVGPQPQRPSSPRIVPTNGH